MWVRLTFGKVKPNSVDEFRKIYNDEIRPIVEKQDGFADAMLLEAVSEEDAFISCTMWDSKENGDAYENSGTYKEMVGKVVHTLEAPPTMKSYEVKK
jgi:heme-degrading monooxygenase HmoA